jgi:alkaline phosphatase D
MTAAEFISTSITSRGYGSVRLRAQEKRMAENPCVRFFHTQRGHVRCNVTPRTWRSDNQVMGDATRPTAPVVARTSFVVAAGEAGSKPP